MPETGKVLVRSLGSSKHENCIAQKHKPLGTMGCSATWLEAHVEIMTKAHNESFPKLCVYLLLKWIINLFCKICVPSSLFALSPPVPLLERTAIHCVWARPKVPQESVLSHMLVVFSLSQSCTFSCILQLPRTSERKTQYLIPLNNVEFLFKVFCFQTALLFPCVVSLIL